MDEVDSQTKQEVVRGHREGGGERGGAENGLSGNYRTAAKFQEYKRMAAMLFGRSVHRCWVGGLQTITSRLPHMAIVLAPIITFTMHVCSFCAFMSDDPIYITTEL